MMRVTLLQEARYVGRAVSAARQEAMPRYIRCAVVRRQVAERREVRRRALRDAA